MIKAGSTVYHFPTGEEWFVLGVNKAKDAVCVAGWPPTTARLSNCKLVDEGNGITADELKYRCEQFGFNWD